MVSKFYGQHEVILKTKLGWHVIYYKLLIDRQTPAYIIVDNVRYAASTGREIGTSTPDYVFRLDDTNEDGLTYSEVYEKFVIDLQKRKNLL